MAFWDSMLGNQLAKTLIRELPKLTKEKEQYTRTVMDQELQSFITEEIQKGNRYISHISYDGFTTVIMEKK